MHVLMVGVSPERIGGMWTVIENYLNNEEFCKQTNLIYVATSTNGSKLKRVLFMLKGYLKIFFILLIKKPEIIHIHMSVRGSVKRKGIVIKIAKLFNCKVLIHMHSGFFIDWYNSKSARVKRKIKDNLLLADMIIVLGKYWMEELSKIVPIEKIGVLYNGVDVSSQNQYNINAKNIIFMGALKKEKGIYDLIKSIELINNTMPNNIHIQICGDDKDGSIRLLISELRLENRFEYLGWIEGEDKEDIYRNAMVNVLPSYHEGLSMTVLEAMAQGIPTITTNISTMSEVLGQNAALIVPGDIISLSEKILQYSTDSTLRKIRSNEEYKIAYEMFGIDNNIKSLLDYYMKLIG